MPKLQPHQIIIFTIDSTYWRTVSLDVETVSLDWQTVSYTAKDAKASRCHHNWIRIFGLDGNGQARHEARSPLVCGGLVHAVLRNDGKALASYLLATAYSNGECLRWLQRTPRVESMPHVVRIRWMLIM